MAAEYARLRIQGTLATQHSATFTSADQEATFDQRLMTLSAIASRQPRLLRVEQMLYQRDLAVLISH